MRATALAILGCVAPLLYADDNQSTRSIDVCDVAHTLQKYHGKLLSVRGLYFSSSHGSTVARERCEPPTTRLGLVSPGISIALEGPEEAKSVRVDARATDEAGLRAFAQAMRSLKDKLDFRVIDVEATFAGTIEVAPNFRIRRLPNGTYLGNGFGPTGTYPAQLILRSVTDIKTILRTSKP